MSQGFVKNVRLEDEKLIGEAVDDDLERSKEVVILDISNIINDKDVSIEKVRSHCKDLAENLEGMIYTKGSNIDKKVRENNN